MTSHKKRLLYSGFSNTRSSHEDQNPLVRDQKIRHSVGFLPTTLSTARNPAGHQHNPYLLTPDKSSHVAWLPSLLLLLAGIQRVMPSSSPGLSMVALYFNATVVGGVEYDYSLLVVRAILSRASALCIQRVANSSRNIAETIYVPQFRSVLTRLT